MVTVAFFLIGIVFLILLLFASANVRLRRTTIVFLLLMVLISICILAYYTVDLPKDDLSRYFYQMDIFRIAGLQYALLEGPWGQTPLSTILLYLVSLTNDNHLLPVVSCFIVRGIYFYIIIDMATISTEKGKFINIRSIIIPLFLLIITNNIYGVISGIRAPIAAAISALGIYLDFTKEKSKWGFCLYIVATLFHINMLNIIFLRVVFGFSRKKNNLWWLIGILVGYFVLIPFLNNSGNIYLQYIYGKTQSYAGFAENGVRWFISKICFFIGMTLLAMSFQFNKKDKLQDKKYVLGSFSVTLTSFLLVMLFIFDYVSMRMQSVALMAEMPLFREKKNKILFWGGVLFISFWIILNIKYDIELYTRWTFY